MLDKEDDFDFEAIQRAKLIHDRRFEALTREVLASGIDIALLSAGACSICGENNCGCPDTPCLNPKLMRPSMEAAGLWVSEVCKDAQIAYNHGPLTISFTSCALL